MTISPRSIAFIVEMEGIDQPWKWPGGGSGITLGVGSDIGADPEALDHWQGVLDPLALASLKQARGLTGRAAAQIAGRFRGITVTKEQAMKVFTERTLPKWIAATRRTFPGVELLPEDARGALVSLVFNRGTDLTGPRRVEMLGINRAVASWRILAEEQRKRELRGLLIIIADLIRKMKRLWEGQGLDGLLRRRDGEAQLVLAASA